MKRRSAYSALYFMVDCFQDLLCLQDYLDGAQGYGYTNETWAEEVKGLVEMYRNLFRLGGYSDLQLWLHICRKFDKLFDEAMDQRFKEDRAGILGWTRKGTPIYKKHEIPV